MKSPWSPDQYERFRDERSQPFRDLLDLVRPRPGMRVVDLGCGTGELTRELHRRLGARETLGIDSSETMLEQSGRLAGDGLAFERASVEDFRRRSEWDLVFSNAALHWCEDHPALFGRLAEALTEGGQLAVQVPANHDHVAFLTAAELAAEEPYCTALDGWVRRSPVLAPEEYARLLDRLGFAEQHVRLVVYPHRLDAPADVVEWVKGTLLTAYRSRLSEEFYGRFLAEYRERLLPALGEERPHFYPFKRVLAWGLRGS